MKNKREKIVDDLFDKFVGRLKQSGADDYDG